MFKKQLQLPPWLANAYTEPHILSVLQTLADRESQREDIRSMSWQRHRQSFPTHASESAPEQARIDHYSVATAYQRANINKNRYNDVVPYDRTRVVVEGHEMQRYLNANWVLERYGQKWWIASQAPLPTTSHAFLSVILQPLSMPRKASTSPSPSYKSRVRTVVQLTNNVENGRTKAHAYFPSEVGKSLTVPPEASVLLPALKVTLLHIETNAEAQCVRSTLAIEEEENSNGTVEEQGQRVIFHHMLYTAWPDHGVPRDNDRASLLAFLKLVDQTNRDMSLCSYPPTSRAQKQYDPDPPMIVGCSAGIGRTGSFIALSSLLRHCKFLPSPAEPTPASVIPPSLLGALPDELTGDLVVEEIDSLREQRPRMVERQEQTLLVYELLIAAFEMQK